MIPYMTFAGKNLLTELNTVVDLSKSFGNPDRSYEYVEILGKDGSLVIDNERYNDLEIDLPAFILKDFIPNYRNLMAFLNSQKGYQRLETSHEPDYFRKALFLGTVQPEPTQFLKKGSFTLPFRAHPQRYLKSGEIPVSATELWNPTYFDSHPLIRCYGNGSLTINSQTITVASNPYDYVDIDCDIMDAFYGANNANQYVSFNTDFVVLESGTNSITHNMTNVLITPRWYEI